jgi:preprotein translocase subunit SecG
LLFITWVIFHIIVCIGLVMVVLLQSSKGGGLSGSAFGGGGGGVGGAVFGGRGAGSFLSKATTYLAVLFMVNCVSLAFISSGNKIDIGTGDAITESAVTRQAQADRERALEQQRLQQEQLAVDSSAQQSPIQITPIEVNTTPVDSGK